MNEQDKNIMVSNAIRILAEGDYIFLDFGHIGAENPDSGNAGFTVHVNIHANYLIGLISTLVNFGMKYEDEFKKDIGFKEMRSGL